MVKLVKHWNRLPKEPGNIQGQVRSGSEQPDPVEDVPAYCKGLDWMTFKLSPNHSVILKQEDEFYTLSLCHLFACKEKMSLF